MNLRTILPLLVITVAGTAVACDPASAPVNSEPNGTVFRSGDDDSDSDSDEHCSDAAVQPLNWDLDPWLPVEHDAAQRLSIPSLTQPFYNSVVDVHATVSAADTSLIFSTNGNWHLALRRLLNENYFPANPTVRDSHILTTSPPISVAQMATGRVKVGNVMYVNAQPHVVVAPGRVLNTLEDNGDLFGDRIAIIRTYGNVILKRNGDDRIESFWDLEEIEPGRFASSDPAEGGSYNNYRNSVFDIAVANPEDEDADAQTIQDEAAALQARLFDEAGVTTIGPPMHRSVPHLIASGEADAGLFFLHLAVTAMRENPGVFSAVYLAEDRVGETDDPDVLAQGQVPLVGNRVGTFALSRTVTAVNPDQEAARESFIDAMRSDEFTAILTDVGLRRP